jgi:autophagy-related protein 2
MLTIVDGSIRAYAPTKPGAAVLYIGDAELSTEITGKSLESTVMLSIQYSSFLAIDDISNIEGASVGLHDMKGVSYWKVSDTDRNLAL